MAGWLPVLFCLNPDLNLPTPCLCHIYHSYFKSVFVKYDHFFLSPRPSVSLESLNDWLFQSVSQHRCSGHLGTHLRAQPPRWPLSYAPRSQGLWFRLCPISTHFTVVLGRNSMHDAGWTQQKVTARQKGNLGRMEELAAENVTGRDLSMISHSCSRGLPVISTIMSYKLKGREVIS